MAHDNECHRQLQQRHEIQSLFTARKRAIERGGRGDERAGFHLRGPCLHFLGPIDSGYFWAIRGLTKRRAISHGAGNNLDSRRAHLLAEEADAMNPLPETRRRYIHGPVQPMDYPRAGLLARLWGVLRRWKHG